MLVRFTYYESSQYVYAFGVLIRQALPETRNPIPQVQDCALDGAMLCYEYTMDEYANLQIYKSGREV